MEGLYAFFCVDKILSTKCLYAHSKDVILKEGQKTVILYIKHIIYLMSLFWDFLNSIYKSETVVGLENAYKNKHGWIKQASKAKYMWTSQ